MHPNLRNSLAVLAGITLCMLLNGLLIGLLMQVFGTPDGFNANIPSTYHLLGAEHYVAPFLAHALPSLFGASLSALLATHRHRSMALLVGILHLLGGITAAFIIPAPMWFTAMDLVLAYVPMAWLGWKLSGRPV
jgi:hypothetical protein